MKDDQKKKDLKEKNDDFKKDFFERLTKQLKSQKMTFKQLAEDMGRDPRFFEIKMRPTGSIPSLQEVKEICSILKVDINYFMNSDGDVRPAQKRVPSAEKSPGGSAGTSPVPAAPPGCPSRPSRVPPR